MLYRYETHLHTFPVSRCAKADVEAALTFYKNLGYDGVFITNHFLDGNINIDPSLPYEEKLSFFFSDYEAAKELSPSIGIKVFLGVESSYKGTDFLIYGLPKEWYFAHPEIMGMEKNELFRMMRADGAFVAQAHPFREPSYLKHIRLFPRAVEAVEVINSSDGDGNVLSNKMAGIYAKEYDLIPFAGSDNHAASVAPLLAGMQGECPIENEADFAEKVRAGSLVPFCMKNPLCP